ncbi:hypothetical protein [Nocardioides sp.]|uniref:hypothetical protein n=1 Tax=Nocardioides sp. TaxID=35761 RepID=UPI003517F9F0
MAPKTHPTAADSPRARDELLQAVDDADPDPDVVLAVARPIATRGRTRTTTRRLHTLAATVDAS